MLQSSYIRPPVSVVTGGAVLMVSVGRDGDCLQKKKQKKKTGGGEGGGGERTLMKEKA